MSDRWFQAAEQGDADALLDMLGQGMDVDACQDGDTTALMLAVWHRRIEAIEILLAHGASITPRDRTGLTALSHAALDSRDLGEFRPNPDPDPRPLDMLLEAGGRLGLRDAVYLENVEVARERLDEGADPNTGADSYLGPVLMTSAQVGNVELINLLLDRGANIEETDDVGKRPLLSAALYGRLEAVRCLIARGAEIDAVGWSHESALANAARAGHREVVDLLLSLGARRRIVDVVALEDEALLVPLLDEAGRHFEWEGYPEPRIALLAASRGNPRIVGLLLDRGAAHLHDRHDDHSLLAEAARHGHAEVVRLLINRGADLHAVGRDGLTPLAWALREGRDEVAGLLRAAGAAW